MPDTPPLDIDLSALTPPGLSDYVPLDPSRPNLFARKRDGRVVVVPDADTISEDWDLSDPPA